MHQFPEFRPGQIFNPAEIKSQFKSLGEKATIYKGCRIIEATKVSVGDHSQIDEGVYIFAGQGVEIGRYVHMASLASISGGGKCELEDYVGIGMGTRIITGSEDVRSPGLTNPTVPSHRRSVIRDKVTIKQHALLFTNVIVFPSITIGEGAVVSAGSIVNRSLEPWTIYAGNPLVPISKREKPEL